MKRLPLIGTFLVVISIAGFGLAQSSTQDQSAGSLGDVARKLRAERGLGKQPTTQQGKVYTNEDIPNKEAGGVNVAASSKESSVSGSASSEARGAKYYRTAYTKLLAKKELDQRQLQVLQKKLNQNDVQYYNDPNEGLKQGYTREDINKNQDDLNQKQQDVAADEQAISDLQDQLRRDGGDPSWLTAGPISIEPDVDAQKPPPDGGDEKDKKKTRDYWQSRFKSAHATLAKAQEAQKLVEDEMNFLKIRQVQEPSADAQAEIKNKLDVAQTNLGNATAVTEKARQNLADLQRAFDGSGAPAEWSVLE